jgi:hypothetical protein
LILRLFERLLFSFRSSCTHKRNECGLHTQRHFISSLSFCFLDFFNEEMHILNHFLYRVQYPLLSSIYAHCIRTCLFVQSLFNFAFVLLLAVTCPITMSSLSNIIMGIRKKKERERVKIDTTLLLFIDDAKMTRIILCFFLLV